MAFSVMSTIATDKDDDFCDYTYDVSLSLWQRLSAVKVELKLELESGCYYFKNNATMTSHNDVAM